MSTRFFNAVKKGEREKVEKMLASNPTLVHTRGKDGLSPILMAAYFRQPEIAELLVDHTVTITIFEAAATGKFQQIVLLLAKNPDLVNAYAEDGFQPLGLAAFFGHLEVVSYLIKAGAWVNSPSKNHLHMTPLASAAAGSYLEVAYRLLDSGADPNIPQENDFTPLHSAAEHGQLEMIRMLLEYGADLHARTKDGKTAQDLALAKGHTLAAQLLRSGITKRFRRPQAS